MSDEDDEDISDYVNKRSVIEYVENNDNLTPPAVLGRFNLPPSLYDDVELLIDLCE